MKFVYTFDVHKIALVTVALALASTMEGEERGAEYQELSKDIASNSEVVFEDYA